MASVYTVQVEDARPSSAEKPSAGPVYRSIYAKDGLLELPEGLESPWEFFSHSVEKNPTNRMLGKRESVDGKVGPYVWKTYQEVYDEAIQVGFAIRSRGLSPGTRCGIYGTNCPEWIVTMEACNSNGICYVPLYDTLGANAVEFIINHAEVSIAFVQENRIQAMLTCLPRCTSYLKTIVSFGKVTDSQRKEAEQVGVSFFAWKQFASLVTPDGKFPAKSKNDICTIMYTSGTTGEPKGVILSNEALMEQVFSVDKLLRDTNKVIIEQQATTEHNHAVMEHRAANQPLLEQLGLYADEQTRNILQLSPLSPQVIDGSPDCSTRFFFHLERLLGGTKVEGN